MSSAKYDKELFKIQRRELLGHFMYLRLSEVSKHNENKKVLADIASLENEHYEKLKEFSGKDIKVNKIRKKVILFLLTLAVKVLGLTFCLKFFERHEKKQTEKNIPFFQKENPKVLEFVKDEETTEQKLLELINEDRLNYTRSIVLGLNDALVELTGALAGFTLSLQNSHTIALLGLITGISASFSMAASEYLATKADTNSDVNASKASIYTGLAYVSTVILLILPFLLISNYIVSLGVTIGIAVLIIAIFNYYISVVQDSNFKKEFGQMAFISIGVALVSFLIGFLVNKYIGIDL